MSPKTILVLVAFVSACAPAFSTVPNDDWQQIAPARRAAVDNAYATQLARLQHELAAANAALAVAPKPATAPVVTATLARPAPGDDWAGAMQSFERDKATARAQIATTTLAWQQAELQYQRERVMYVQRELDELRARHELDRAMTIDHSLEASDTYETAGYRGQLAAVQTPRFESEHRVDAARMALQRTSIAMVQAKDSYASIVRTGPLAPTSQDAALELTAFTPTTRYEKSKAPQHYLTAPRIAWR
ncbi:MAG TPA: hypothetical protein VH143_06765 [Kofleriaceae bacterium]|jgi:hypothetical protein|nr:hypothetical protein [Kofleriaceae bacterium]